MLWTCVRKDSGLGVIATRVRCTRPCPTNRYSYLHTRLLCYLLTNPLYLQLCAAHTHISTMENSQNRCASVWCCTSGVPFAPVVRCHYWKPWLCVWKSTLSQWWQHPLTVAVTLVKLWNLKFEWPCSLNQWKSRKLSNAYGRNGFLFPVKLSMWKKGVVHSSSEDHPSTFSPPQFPFSLINYLHIYRIAQYLTLNTGFDGPNQMPYSTTNTTIGGLPPPPGVIPNFVNPYSRGWLIILTIVICLTLTTLLIGIRICTKFLITKSHGWEDCKYIFLSQSVTITLSITTITIFEFDWPSADMSIIAWVRRSFSGH